MFFLDLLHFCLEFYFKFVDNMFVNFTIDDGDGVHGEPLAPDHHLHSDYSGWPDASRGGADASPGAADA